MSGDKQPSATKRRVRFLSPDELLRLQIQVERGECLLIDVRGNAEFEASHISCAKLIPLVELERRKAELDRSRMVVVYCRTGKRALQGAQALCDSGFGNVYVLEGGMENWERMMKSAVKSGDAKPS
jgi:rhodanese-related sulfurtransferase